MRGHGDLQSGQTKILASGDLDKAFVSLRCLCLAAQNNFMFNARELVIKFPWKVPIYKKHETLVLENAFVAKYELVTAV